MLQRVSGRKEREGGKHRFPGWKYVPFPRVSARPPRVQLSSRPIGRSTGCLLLSTYERLIPRYTARIAAKEWRTVSSACPAIIRIMSALFNERTMPLSRGVDGPVSSNGTSRARSTAPI